MSKRFSADHLALLVLLAVLCVLPFTVTGYVLYVVNLLMVFVVLALGLHVVIGEAGQFALAHTAFYGIGIYTAGLINTTWHPPFVVSILAGGLLSAVLGYVIGFLALRMRDIYLALATFAFGEAMQWVFLNWESVTNGSNGMRMQPAQLFGLTLTNDLQAYPFVIAIAALMLWVTVWLSRSQFGSALRAVRERRRRHGDGHQRARHEAGGLRRLRSLRRHRGRHVHPVHLLHPPGEPGLPDHHPDPDDGGGRRHRLGARRGGRRHGLRHHLRVAAPGAVDPGDSLRRHPAGLHDVQAARPVCWI
jgi:hypothetical protein